MERGQESDRGQVTAVRVWLPSPSLASSPLRPDDGGLNVLISDVMGPNGDSIQSRAAREVKRAGSVFVHPRFCHGTCLRSPSPNLQALPIWQEPWVRTPWWPLFSFCWSWAYF